MKHIIYLLIFNILQWVGCNHSPPCDLEYIEKKWADYGINAGSFDGYTHFVIIKNFEKQCLDSTVIMNITQKYLDTATVDIPIQAILFFNSDKHFIEGETSQDWEKVNKDCLVGVYFNIQNKKFTHFRFFESNGIDFEDTNKWKIKN